MLPPLSTVGVPRYTVGFLVLLHPRCQMCCEQDECKLAVFNEVEAVCYLKGTGAEDAANRVAAEGVSTYTIERRTGKY